MSTKRITIVPTERTIESVSSSVPKLAKVPSTKQQRQRKTHRDDQTLLHTINLEEVRIPPNLDVGALPTSQIKREAPKYVTVSTVSFSRTLSPETPLITLGNAVSPSKRVLILVGVHGDEPCGLIAFNELLEEHFFDRVPSDIHITALVGNPLAVSKSQRFVDVNLNRMVRKDLFHTGVYESERARVVAEAIDKCDVLLDLHSCSADAPPHALPMDDPESMELASRLPVGFVIRHLAHTTPGKATTLDWAKEKGIVAVGVECGQHEQRSTVEHAKNCIKTVLEIVGDKPISTTFPPCKVLSCKENEPVRKGFQFSRDISAFEKVPFGEVIASDQVVGKIFSKYPGGTFIVMPTRKPVLGEEAWYYAELVY